MRTLHFTITSNHVHSWARARLEENLAFKDHGPKCTANLLYNILLWAACHTASLAAACATLLKAPSDDAVHDALAASLPNLHELQKQINRALAGGLPKALLRRSQPIAIDLTHLPYYGQPAVPGSKQLYHGETKAGTRNSHAYATAYVVQKGLRFPLGLVVVHHSDPWEEIVRELLRQVRKTGVKIRYVLLDKGFYSVSVIRYLQAARYPFLMPAIRRGRKPDHAKGASGTWALTELPRNRWVEYTLQDKKKNKARVKIGVYHHRLPAKTRDGRELKGRRQKVWLYAVWKLEHRSLTWIANRYRERFGIESSYRLLNEVRIRTTKRCPVYRLLCVGIALILCNEWVGLHWDYLALSRRGRRVVDLNQLPLRAMAHWIEGVVETLLGVCKSLTTQRPCPQLVTSTNSGAA
jgi:hypothetical protein